MALSTFLDIVWAELWDDVSPMGDRARYHKIIVELFIEGKDPYDITWRDHDNKLQRLSNQRSLSRDSKATPDVMAQVQEWRDILKTRRESLVTSRPDASDAGSTGA